MKKLLFFVYAMIIAVVSLFAQAPQKFSYQAVLRDAGGNLAANQNVSVRISIIQENEYGASVYVETHSVTTNANGLVTIEVGAGNPILGSFADIDWSYGSYYLKSEVDPAGGNNYSITGVKQLLSVPYALYAGNTTGGFSGDYNDLVNTPDIPTVPTNVSAFTNDAQYITQSALGSTLQGYATVGSIPTVPTNISAFVNDRGYITSSGVPTNVAAFENDAHYITEAQFNTILSALNNALDSLRGRIAELETTSTPFICGTSTMSDIDGNVYNTVQIGTQCWMVENLRATRYADGTPIPMDSTYSSYTEPYRYAPGANQSNEENMANVPRYGYLYNWPAVMHGASSSNANPSGVQGICPTGWHAPSDAEWNQLTDYVSSQSQYYCSDNPENIAKALASISNWNSCSTICAVGDTPSNNNATGFSALPAGSYYMGVYEFYSTHNSVGRFTYFWSATESSSSYAYIRKLSYDDATVDRTSNYKCLGNSVRCVRD